MSLALSVDFPLQSRQRGAAPSNFLAHNALGGKFWLAIRHRWQTCLDVSSHNTYSHDQRHKGTMRLRTSYPLFALLVGHVSSQALRRSVRRRELVEVRTLYSAGKLPSSLLTMIVHLTSTRTNCHNSHYQDCLKKSQIQMQCRLLHRQWKTW